MKILTFSSPYPNAHQPSHGVFVENRLRQLLAYALTCRQRWSRPCLGFLLSNPMFGSYASYAGVETRGPSRYRGLAPEVSGDPQDRYAADPWIMYQSVRRTVRRLKDSGFDFDLIDAHYFYPDGVAAMRLAAEFERPFVVTGRGTST